MRVTMILAYTGEEVGVLDLQPSNLRRLTEVEYHGTAYAVVDQHTRIEKGLPVATLRVRRKGDPR